MWSNNLQNEQLTSLSWLQTNSADKTHRREENTIHTHQVGQGDHHERVPRPDVQIIRLHGKLGEMMKVGQTKWNKQADICNGVETLVYQQHPPPQIKGRYCMEEYLSVDGWHGELHVAVGDVGLAVVEAAAAEELLADGWESSITAYNQVRLDLILGSIRPEKHTSNMTTSIKILL